MKEIWRDIDGYGGLYRVSNMGNISGLKRKKKLNPGLNGGGYRHVILSIKSKLKTYKVCWLVWDAFGDRERDGLKLQIDHINNIKTDDAITNLQLLSARENVTKFYVQNGSKYNLPTGVTFDKNNKRRKKYQVQITTNGKIKNLGYYWTPQEGSEIYQQKLREITNAI